MLDGGFDENDVQERIDQRRAKAADIGGLPSRQVAQGAYQHGRGQYSDNPAGMQAIGRAQVGGLHQPAANVQQAGGFGLQRAAAPAFEQVPVGGLNEQPRQQQGNGISSGAASAQRVADIYRSMVSDQSAGGVNVPQALHSGNSWAAANELRNARVSANSITNQGRFSKWGNQASPAQLEYAALLARDADARKAGFGLQQEGMRQAGNIRQEGIRQAGHLQQEQMRDAMQAGGDAARLGLDAQKLGLDARRLGLQEAELAHKMSQPSQTAVQLPTAALKMQREEMDAMGTASAIDADLGAINRQLENGELKLGPVRNVWNRTRNFLGLSTPESRNLASFDASLEKIRNDSLRLNKGVQTESDAQRAMNEVVSSTSDPALIRQRLGELQNINQRAAGLRAANVEQIRSNFGLPPLDMSAHSNLPPALGKGQAQQQAQAQQQGMPSIKTADEWAALAPGAVYMAADGSIRRKKQ